jgi:hypothetical protein
MNKRSFASVTDIECTCHYLQNMADDPDWPIEYDSITAEYHFVFKDNVDGRKRWLMIFHCPYCGGATPKSKRETLFYNVPQEERDRLSELAKGIRTFKGALKRLGPPCYETDGEAKGPEKDGKPPTYSSFHDAHYTNLSPIADLVFTGTPSGKVQFHISGKQKSLSRVSRKKRSVKKTQNRKKKAN